MLDAATLKTMKISRFERVGLFLIFVFVELNAQLLFRSLFSHRVLLLLKRKGTNALTLSGCRNVCMFLLSWAVTW